MSDSARSCRARIARAISHHRAGWPCLVLVLIALAASVVAQPAAAQDGRIAPEADTGRYAKSAATAKNYMVSAANPLAVDAGLEMLGKGGSAVDAAIAIQLVLNLVEPQSSGIGGGAFLLHWDEGTKQLKSYDGRETAPAAATPERFLRDGKRLPFWTAVKSGLSIGVPGLVRLLEHAHREHGVLPWRDLFAPAIRHANEGFRVSPRLHNLLLLQGAKPFSEGARQYFFGAGPTDGDRAPHPVGHVLKNPAFAETLRRLRDGGADAFYSGPIAAAVVTAAGKAPNFAGDITLEDLGSYQVKERAPVCSIYRKHRVCGMGPPSSGALTVAQTLKLVERYSLGLGPSARLNPSAMHLLAEAQKLAFADRNRYMADPDFVTVPGGLLDDAYVAERAKLINLARAMPRPEPGRPAWRTCRSLWNRLHTRERRHQPHLCRRQDRECRVDDNDHRIGVRFGRLGRRLSAQQ